MKLQINKFNELEDIYIYISVQSKEVETISQKHNKRASKICRTSSTTVIRVSEGRRERRGRKKFCIMIFNFQI